MANGKMDEKRCGCFAWLIRVKRSVNLRWAKARDSLRRKLNKKRRVVRPQVDDEVINEDGLPDLIITKMPIKPRPSSPCKEPKDDVPMTAPAPELEGDAKVDKTVDQPPDERTFIKCDSNGDPDETELRNFVLDIINDAILELEGQTTDADLDETVKPPDPDNVSMTSSVLSELATAAVQESLTNVIDDFKEHKMTMIDNGSSLSSGAISDLATAAVHDSLTNIIDDIKEENKAVMDDHSSLSSDAISMLAEAAVTESPTRIVNKPDDENYSARKATLIPRTVTEVLEQLDIDTSIGLCVHAELEFPPCSP